MNTKTNIPIQKQKWWAEKPLLNGAKQTNKLFECCRSLTFFKQKTIQVIELRQLKHQKEMKTQFAILIIIKQGKKE